VIRINRGIYNFKFEARNPKFETISNDQILNVQNKCSSKKFEIENSDLPALLSRD